MHLVLIGATADGKKEVRGITDGYRESEQSGRELLLLKARGLTIDPNWPAEMGLGLLESVAASVWGPPRATLLETQRSQRAQLPTQRITAKAKTQLNEISIAENLAAADRAFDQFLLSYEAKHPKATECLAKDG